MKPSKSRKYKAIIFDVDGTLIPNKEDGIPSKKVKEAIKKAQQTINISIATSRPLKYVEHIIDDLDLRSPMILTGGAEIYDPSKKRVIWKKEISKDSTKEILKVFKKYKMAAIANNGVDPNIGLRELSENFTPLQFWFGPLTNKKADEVIKDLNHIAFIISHKIPSWEKGKIAIIITNSEATKHHGILHIAKLLNIKTKEMIGVGDGYNDFPLLLACGLKVAMGNAVEDLKAIADYVAPSVENDGVVDVIEKFILRNKTFRL